MIKNINTQKNIVQGVVLSTTSKTAKILTYTRVKHRKYKKFINIFKKYMVHDPNNICKEGDKVKFVTSKVFSSKKKWIIYKIVENREI